MLPVFKHIYNPLRRLYSLQIGNISSISDRLENLNSHFLKQITDITFFSLELRYSRLLLLYSVPILIEIRQLLCKTIFFF
jgi:hypothetical protein